MNAQQLTQLTTKGLFDQTPRYDNLSPLLPGQGNAFGVPTPATTVAATGDNNIDGLLTGVKWVSTSVSFSFTDSIDDYEAGYADRAAHGASFQTLNPTQRAVARAWIGPGGAYYNVSLLSPSELSGASDRDATIRMAMSDVPGTAFAYYPNSSFVEGGDAWFNRVDYNSPVIGNYAYHTFGHELGHALGLKHGHELGGPANVAMNPDRDSMEFSIMTYRSYVGHDLTALPFYTNETWGYAQSLMMYDIAAIQHMYGPWFGYNSGNTTYTFSTTTGEMFVDGVGQGTPGANRIFRTIWDGNGVDTYDFSNYTTNLSIDLTPGRWSDLDVGGNSQRAMLNAGYGGITAYARGHVFNALQYSGDASSLIENANGGSGNDVITGNIANNVLYGNGGNDTVNGGDGDDLIYLGDGDDFVDTVALGNDTFYGGSGNDFIFGASGNETYYGEDGNDTLKGWFGNDIIDGGANNDYIDGGAGNDTVNGGDGDDLIYLGDGDDFVDTVALGNDTFYGGSGNDFIFGGSGNEIYYGEDGNDTLLGWSGNDTINGGAGADSLDGGADTDTLSYAGSPAAVTVNLAANTVSGGDGTGDTIVNFENVTGSSFNDSLTGSSANNTIDGGAGNDTVNGGDGDDLIYLGDGDDYVNTVALGNDTFYGGSGNDFIFGGSGNEIYYGQDGNDTLLGWSGNDTINGGAGADSLDGGADTDTLSYAGSPAAVTVNLAANTVSGGDGTGDTIVNFENVTGSSFNDSLTGSSVNNTLDGGSGNDTYIFDADTPLGSDVVTDAAGVDTLNFASTTTKAVSVNLGSIAAQVVTPGNLTLTLTSASALENVTGGSLNDILTGNSLNNSLSGGNGNDNLNGAAGNDNLTGANGNDNLTGANGNDNLTGANGNDNLTGANGNDNLNGGANNDTYIFDADTPLGSDVVTDATGVDTLNFASTTTKAVSVNLGSIAAQVVTPGNLTLTLTSASALENVTGGSLNDILTGNSLNNSLSGGNGNDSLKGLVGNDNLNGGAGNDTLTGGPGNDILTGGLGLDHFVFNSFSEGIDTISAFVVADDTIRVSAAGFGGGLVAGAPITAAQFVIGAAAADASDRFIYHSLSGALYFDRDGSLGGFAQVQLATLSAGLAMTNSDIFVMA